MYGLIVRPKNNYHHYYNLVGGGGDSRAGEAHKKHTASSDLQEMPPERGDPLCVGEELLSQAAGQRALDQLTTCPPARGGHSRPYELPSEGAPD